MALKCKWQTRKLCSFIYQWILRSFYCKENFLNYIYQDIKCVDLFDLYESILELFASSFHELWIKMWKWNVRTFKHNIWMDVYNWMVIRKGIRKYVLNFLFGEGNEDRNHFYFRIYLCLIKRKIAIYYSFYVNGRIVIIHSPIPYFTIILTQ